VKTSHSNGMGRVGRPPAVDSAETRRRILQSARARFAADGYRATTNQRIADDVGITPGALYHYVSSKAELYAAVYTDAVDRVYSAFEEAAAGADGLVDQLLAVLRTAADLQRDDPSTTGFIVAVALETQRHPDLLALMGEQRGRHTRFFNGLVAAAAERGELCPGANVGAIGDLFGAILTGLARMSASTGDPARYNAATDALDSLLNGELLSRRG
jgi:AcrR family transcriptional regulator